MKQFLSWAGKKAVGGVITGVFFILAILGIVYALSYPSTPPTGEVVGGKFMQYFNNIKGTCPTGQYLSGYDTNFNKICVTIPNTGFGGAFVTGSYFGAGCLANPKTGRCSCPTGTSAHDPGGALYTPYGIYGELYLCY